MKIKIAAIALCALAGASAAQADTVNMYFDGTAHGRNVRATAFGNSINVFAGQLKHEITAGTGVGAQLVGSWRTYCADFDQHVSGSTSVFDIVLPIELTVRGIDLGAGKAAALSGLYSTHGSSASASNAADDLGAAFQILVWEILYDFNPGAGVSSINLTTGNMTFTQMDGGALAPGIVNQFNGLLASLSSGGSAQTLLALESGVRQDQLLYGPNISVPTPGAAVLAMCGTMMIFRRRRAA